MRCFIGIALPEDVRTAVVTACRELQDLESHLRDDKWVPRDNLHVTLKFLGEVSAESLDAVIRSLELACATIQPFDLELRRLRAVPNAKHATMLWAVGTEAGQRAEHCAALAGAIDEALEPLGFERDERAFKAHVTLCRTRRPRKVHVDSILRAQEPLGEPDSMSVPSVTLYRSTLGGGSPVYEVLAEVPLGND